MHGRSGLNLELPFLTTNTGEAVQDSTVRVSVAPLLSAGQYFNNKNNKQETRISECKGSFKHYTKEQVLCETEACKMEEERRTLVVVEAEENARSKERRAELLKQPAAAESAKDAARKAAEEKEATLLTVDRAGNDSMRGWPSSQTRWGCCSSPILPTNRGIAIECNRLSARSGTSWLLLCRGWRCEACPVSANCG